MPGTPWSISFLLEEFKKLQVQSRWLTAGPICAAVLLMAAAVLVLMVTSSPKVLLRETPAALPARQEQANQSVPDSDGPPAVTSPVQESANIAATAATSVGTAQSISSGTPCKPVDGPVKLAFGWQFQPDFNDWRYNVGIDIGAAENCPVRALYSGKVTEVYKDTDYGLTIVVASGADSVYYGSLNAASLAEGQQVRAGERIGSVGSCYAEPYFHLHLAIKTGDGQYIDPQEVLSKAE